MLIPCIDLQGGQAVQLVHGRKRELAVADVFAQLHKFRRYRWLHIIDLDAAMGKGENNLLVEALCRQARRSYGMQVRVGGGIRTVERAKQVVAIGATQFIVGSAAFKNQRVDARFLQHLNQAVRRNKIVIALDTYRGKIVTHGWQKSVSVQPVQVMAKLEAFCAGFLCTDVDREGTLCGANLEYFSALRKATEKPIIAAGGIKSLREISALEKLGIDAAVGMALYRNKLQ